MLDYVEHEYQMYRDYLAQRHMVSWIYGECNVDKQCLHCVHMKQNRAWATEQLLIGVIKKPIDTVSKQYFLSCSALAIWFAVADAKQRSSSLHNSIC